MKFLIEYFIERSMLVNLLTFLIFVAGAFSAYTLQKDMFPQVDFDVILITASYSGSSTEDVENLVTIPIERKIKGIDGIKEMNALSAEGRSIVYIDVDPEAKLSEVLEDVKNAVDSITDLPDDVDPPLVRSLDNKSRSILKIAVTDESSNPSYQRMSDAAKALRDYLEEDPSISFVELSGYREDEIRVLVDPKKMLEKDLSLGEISTAISRRHINLSAGKIEKKNESIFLRTLSEFEGPEEIKKLVLRSNTDGRAVLLEDVARVEHGPVEGEMLMRARGKNTILLQLKISSHTDILKSSDRAKELTEKFFQKYRQRHKDIGYEYLDDLSYYVKRRLNVLKNNGIQGLILVLLCLMLFLNTRTSIVTSLGAPMAFMCTFILMDAFGLHINLISMFGLILVLGMLVDDSIIVAEQFYQNLEKGMNAFDSAKKAATETVVPVLGTILTTMIAFSSLFFMGGIMGKFLWQVPAIVILCLASSFLECF